MKVNGIVGKKVNKEKIVFVPMACDFIHEGHLNIIKKASKFGKVTVGLLTDEAIAVYKPIPTFSFDQRYKVIKAVKGVSAVEKTEDWDYVNALERIKPDFVVHGDDWKSNNQKQVRKNVISQLRTWKGKLIEIPYTKGISSSDIKNILRKNISASHLRAGLFKRLLKSKKLIRLIEVHNGLSGLIAEHVNYNNIQFDGMWLSSLTHSTSKGKPDIEYIDDTTVSKTILDIFDITTKPLILDGDSGGKVEHFKFMLQNIDRLGVSGVIIEDKIGTKINSLSKISRNQMQDKIENFCHKIKEGKKVLKNSDTILIARIESFIVGKGVKDAINRAKKYIEAGADGIMIHSKKSSPIEIFNFCKLYNKLSNRKPLVVVPTTYNKVSEKQLENKGVNVVIYANQLIRSAYPAMKKVAKSILKNKRSYEADKHLMPIEQILDLIEK